MMISLTHDEFSRLTPSTQAELIRVLTGTVPHVSSASEVDSDLFADFSDMHQAVDLTPAQIDTWMEAAQDKTKLGLRIIAEHGPIVDVLRLVEAGIDNLRHFQSRVTVRTRTVTGQRDAFMFAWDRWLYNVDKLISGRYAVTPTTHASLRKYFGLEPIAR